MKKLLVIIAAAAVSCVSADAQSLKDILKSTAESVLNSVTGATVSKADLTSGTWTYKGAAVELISEESAVSNIAGKAAQGTIESKVDEELGKIGIKEGIFTFTFAENNTFKMSYKGKSINGTYALGDGTISLMFGKTLKKVRLDGTIVPASGGCRMLFPSQKFLNFVKAILKMAGEKNSTADAMSTLLKSYDNMKLGFYLTK